MNNKIVVISRQFGSGGRAIGKKLAEKLNIKFYDLAIIGMFAERSHVDYDTALEIDEKKIKQKWYFFPEEVDSKYNLSRIPVNDKLFQIQKEIIFDLARKSSCVIIGRGADYMLRESKNMISVFVHADRETKVKSVMKHYNLEREEALKLMKKTDSQRSRYYNSYTEYKWGNVDNYDLMINRGKFGIDGSSEILLSAYNEL
ncbi:cytidylate kinase-like family protein [Clostridium sp. BJN0001]|uniref:cytidylate kinase-like family protein n=1 Tax=Clostridium sp. BJN0001 TaxID=2930219 RepID=UPI001FD41AA5|nr:cytidylate kinase-like family protein [Clostridium sp. BJN0001]